MFALRSRALGVSGNQRAANVNIGKPVAVTTYAEDVLRGSGIRG